MVTNERDKQTFEPRSKAKSTKSTSKSTTSSTKTGSSEKKES